MKHVKRTLLAVLSLLLSLTSCQAAIPASEGTSTLPSDSETPSEATDPTPWETVTLNVVNHLPSVFLPVGRTYTRNGSLACDFTCTGIRFSAECEGDVSVYIRSTSKAYFTLYVNGKRADQRFSVSNSFEWITLAQDLPKGTYDFEFVKHSQYHMATVELQKVSLTGIFHPAPEQRKLFIEYYGDSIVNGSNIHVGTKTNTENSDGTLAYGWLTAQALNADCNIVGRGGLSLSVESEMDIMNDVFDLCGSSQLQNVPTYDFARIPDVVVVNMGCNDGARATQTTVETFKARVTELIHNIRTKYGDDIRIVWIYGYRRDAKEYWDYIKEVMEQMGGEYGNLYACQVSVCYIPKSEGGDGYHPDVKNAQIMANEVTAYLQNLLKT
ncbi:MAG: hypothetical protein IJY47_04705 [Clostridia bacterium]|nr:hypothetical protein [Clostridia bacterium]